MGRKLGAVPLWGGELGPHLTQCGQAEPYVRAKFHLDLSYRLATLHQRHRQDRQTGQQSDGIGRTVLQTVAQPCLHDVVGIQSHSASIKYHRLTVYSYCHVLCRKDTNGVKVKMASTSR